MRTVGIGAAVCAATVLGLAAPASATELQTTDGRPYTGPLAAELSEPAVFDIEGLEITCAESIFAGEAESAGSFGNPATGTIDFIDWNNPLGMQGCTSDNPVQVTHTDFDAQFPPTWDLRLDWLSDNTSGAPNGTGTVSGVRIRADFHLVIANEDISCVYVGDFAGSAGDAEQVQVDFFNPDNTVSGETELVLEDEPLEVVTPGACQDTFGDATLSARYVPVADAVDLQLRNPPPATPAPGATPAESQPDPRCKKLRKKLRRAKKLDQDKRERKLRRKLRRLGCSRS